MSLWSIFGYKEQESFVSTAIHFVAENAQYAFTKASEFAFFFWQITPSTQDWMNWGANLWDSTLGALYKKSESQNERERQMSHFLIIVLGVMAGLIGFKLLAKLWAKVFGDTNTEIRAKQKIFHEKQEKRDGQIDLVLTQEYVAAGLLVLLAEKLGITLSETSKYLSIDPTLLDQRNTSLSALLMAQRALNQRIRDTHDNNLLGDKPVSKGRRVN